MIALLTRRSALAGAMALAAADAALRGDGGPRLPNLAQLWARMPLPYTPVEAWRLLSPDTQAEIGAAVIGIALADYVAGQSHAVPGPFLDAKLQAAAADAAADLSNALAPRLWALFPDLLGSEGRHASWALDFGMVR